MDKKLLLAEAFSFFGIEPTSPWKKIQDRYRTLAKKYHPDTGEFTSPEVFQKLQEYWVLIQDFRKESNLDKIEPEKSPVPKSQPEDSKRVKKSSLVFALYKKAKETETRALLEYFEKTKNKPLSLEDSENPALLELRKVLGSVIKDLKEVAEEKPPSIWAKDARDSIQRLSVWLD